LEEGINVALCQLSSLSETISTPAALKAPSPQRWAVNVALLMLQDTVAIAVVRYSGIRLLPQSLQSLNSLRAWRLERSGCETLSAMFAAGLCVALRVGIPSQKICDGASNAHKLSVPLSPPEPCSFGGMKYPEAQLRDFWFGPFAEQNSRNKPGKSQF
jgi:hypothetical protein